MNKNSDHVQNFFFRDGCGGRCLQLIFPKLLKLSKTSRARKLILGLQVNIEPIVADMTLPGRRYIGGSSKDLQSAHQCTVILCEVKLVQITCLQSN